MTQSLDTTDPFIRDAANRQVIRLSDIAHDPDEMVEKCRTNPQASQLLQEYCQRISESSHDESTRLMAMGVRTALRANVRFELAYRWHIQLQNPENKNLSLLKFKEVYALAILAYHTGNAALHNGMVISNKYANKLLHDERIGNATWIGAHVTAVSLLDNLIHHMKDAIEDVLPEMPRGYRPAFNLLRIKLENLLEKSRHEFDSHVNATIFTTYPFAAREWMDEGISGTLHCESIISDHFSKDLPVIAKTLTIAMQKQHESIPRVKAYLYMMLYIIKGIIEKSDALAKEWDDTKMSDKPQNTSFRKDWGKVMEQGIVLRNCICCGKKDLTIQGDFATLAEEKCEKMLEDITEKMAFRIVRHADMTVILQYTDFALAQIMLRLHNKQPLPLSWVVCLRKIMGNKSDFRKVIGQIRNPKLIPDIPTDDPVDAGEYITELLSPLQSVHMQTDEDGDIQTVVQTDDNEIAAPIERIILLREHMLGNQWGKPDWIPKDTNSRNLDELTRRLYRSPRLILSDDDLAWLYYTAESMAGMNRMLRAVGPMGNPTRRLLKNLHLADILDRCNANVIATYRRRGYDIPVGCGNIFLQELRNLAKVNNQKTSKPQNLKTI